MDYYRKLEWKGWKNMLGKGLAGIIAHANILDDDWFEHPAYPVEEPRCRILANAVALKKDGNQRAAQPERIPEARKWSVKGWERVSDELIDGRDGPYVGNGKRRPVPMPEDKWHANIPCHHEAYITEEEYRENKAILDQNRSQFKSDGSRVTPPRPWCLTPFVLTASCQQPAHT